MESHEICGPFATFLFSASQQGYQKRPAGLPENLTVCSLQLDFFLLDWWHVLAPGTYQVNLKIGAANAEPIDETFEFTNKGTWTDDDPTMRCDYLAVSLK